MPPRVHAPGRLVRPLARRRRPSARSRHRWLAPLALVLLPAVAAARSDFLEDFEDDPIGAWPAAWVADGNGTNTSQNHVVSDPDQPGNRVLRLYGVLGGCWGTLAYHPFDFGTDFVFRARMRPGGENLTGCHPHRGSIGMRQGTHWTHPSRNLLMFYGDGTIRSDGGVILAGYQVGRWYDIEVRYHRSGTDLTLEYRIDGAYVATVHRAISNLANELSLDHIELTSQEGSAWFDDVRVDRLGPEAGALHGEYTKSIGDATAGVRLSASVDARIENGQGRAHAEAVGEVSFLGFDVDAARLDVSSRSGPGESGISARAEIAGNTIWSDQIPTSDTLEFSRSLEVFQPDPYMPFTLGPVPFFITGNVGAGCALELDATLDPVALAAELDGSAEAWGNGWARVRLGNRFVNAGLDAELRFGDVRVEGDFRAGVFEGASGHASVARTAIELYLYVTLHALLWDWQHELLHHSSPTEFVTLF